MFHLLTHLIHFSVSSVFKFITISKLIDSVGYFIVLLEYFVNNDCDGRRDVVLKLLKFVSRIASDCVLSNINHLRKCDNGRLSYWISFLPFRAIMKVYLFDYESVSVSDQNIS